MNNINLSDLDWGCGHDIEINIDDFDWVKNILIILWQEDVLSAEEWWIFTWSLYEAV